MSDTGVFSHDPEATLDYSVDWSDWLGNAETIDTVVWTVPEGLTAALEDETDGVCTVWLSGGVVNRTQKVECKITTNFGRVDERTIRLSVRER